MLLFLTRTAIWISCLLFACLNQVRVCVYWRINRHRKTVSFAPFSTENCNDPNCFGIWNGLSLVVVAVAVAVVYISSGRCTPFVCSSQCTVILFRLVVIRTKVKRRLNCWQFAMHIKWRSEHVRSVATNCASAYI